MHDTLDFYMRGSLRSHKGTAILAAICALVLLFFAVATCLPVHGEEKIYDAVIRLHVIANSDSEEDQADKLAVRDAVLRVAAKATQQCQTREQARIVLDAIRPELEQAALQVLASRGREQPVAVTLDEERYPSRTYDSFCFPAGEYLSLRVMIGEASGENFWCVLFPPMCLGAASVSRREAEDAMISVGLTPDQYRIITETQNTKYKLRFRFLEFFERFR